MRALLDAVFLELLVSPWVAPLVCFGFAAAMRAARWWASKHPTAWEAP